MHPHLKIKEHEKINILHYCSEKVDLKFPFELGLEEKATSLYSQI
jgi:hypothetical protein